MITVISITLAMRLMISSLGLLKVKCLLAWKVEMIQRL
jgi:hypothetical protein